MSKKPATATATPELTLSETTVTFVPLSMFSVEEGYNLRHFDPVNNPDDQAFVKSIIADGKIRDPLTGKVVNGKVEIQAGHRRYFAALEAERNGVKPFPPLPVLSVPLGQTAVDRTYDLFTSNSGKPLSPIERAAGIKRLHDMGQKDSKIAAKTGVSTQWVRQMLLMATMPAFLAEAVYAGRIKSTLASELTAESGRKGFDLEKVWASATEAAREDAKWDAPTGHYVWRVTQKHIDPVLQELGKAMDKSRIRPPAPGSNPPDAPAVKSDDTTDTTDTDDSTVKPTVATKTGAEMPAPTPKPAAKPSDATIPGVTAGVPLYRLTDDHLWVVNGKGEREHACWTIRDHRGNPVAFATTEDVGRSIITALVTAARVTKTVIAAPELGANVPAETPPPLTTEEVHETVANAGQDAPAPEPVQLVPAGAHKPAKGKRKAA